MSIPYHQRARNEIGERVEVFLPVRSSTAPSGKWRWVPGTISGLDERGVTVEFDYPTNGLPNCHATYDELRPADSSEAPA
jgi:hypothetical protein